MLKLNVVKNDMVQQWPVSGQEGTGQGDSGRSKASKRTSARRRARVRRCPQGTQEPPHRAGRQVLFCHQDAEMPLNSMVHSNKLSFCSSVNLN